MKKDKQQKPHVELPTNETISKKEEIKVNPNPKANANVPDAEKRNNEETNTGPGSEITDGEDG